MMNEPFDFRYEIIQNPEPDQPSDMYTVRVIELVIAPPDETWPCETLVDGEVLECFTTDDPYRDVEAAREVQAIPDIEERWTMYAERGF